MYLSVYIYIYTQTHIYVRMYLKCIDEDRNE